MLTDCHYKERADLAMDIAEVLRCQLEAVEADVVQLDEAYILGHPEDAAWAAEAINHVLDGVPNETAVHICFGNYGGQTIQRGFWRDLIPFLNSTPCRSPGAGIRAAGLRRTGSLARSQSEHRLGIGVIDIKDNEIESPELIASRLETIVKTLGEGGSSTFIPTADSGCCTAASSTARCTRWSKVAICSKAGPDCLRTVD